MPVEEQILIIFTLTHGFLDDIKVQDIRKFETEFLSYVHKKKEKIVKKLRDKKEIDDQLEKDMKDLIKKFKAAALLFALVSMAGGVQAGGDPAAGKDKAGLCMGCHGEDGMAVNPECPNLAGQKAGYIIKQVLDFQKGHRDNPTMTPMAAMAGELQDIKDIAAFYASQKSMAASRFMMPPPDDKKMIAKGEKLFNEGNPETGVYGCVNCHGPKGKGKAADNHVFPVVGGQHKEYVAKQLRDFRSTERKNDPANMMMDIAKKLTDEEIEALASYLGSL